MAPDTVRNLTVLALAAAFLLPEGAAAWGERTHEIINRRAVEALPGPAGDAWRPLAASMGAHASDADHRKGSDPAESPRHYLDADAFDRPPFHRIPRTWDAMLRKYGPVEAKSFGTAPWAVDECYRMVVRSLQQGDWSSAGAWAADLGHYVGDTHQPLHCTVNFDGQRTGHDGVHLRWEVFTMDHHYREETLPEHPVLPEVKADAAAMCLGWIAHAYAGVDTILAGETAARAADPGFGPRYEEVLWSKTSALAERQVALAVSDLASLLEAAWEQAGRPPGPEQPPAFQARSVEALEGPAERSQGLSLKALAVAAVALAGALVASSR